MYNIYITSNYLIFTNRIQPLANKNSIQSPLADDNNTHYTRAPVAERMVFSRNVEQER